MCLCVYMWLFHCVCVSEFPCFHAYLCLFVWVCVYVYLCVCVSLCDLVFLCVYLYLGVSHFVCEDFEIPFRSHSAPMGWVLNDINGCGWGSNHQCLDDKTIMIRFMMHQRTRQIYSFFDWPTRSGPIMLWICCAVSIFNDWSHWHSSVLTSVWGTST